MKPHCYSGRQELAFYNPKKLKIVKVS